MQKNTFDFGGKFNPTYANNCKSVSGESTRGVISVSVKLFRRVAFKNLLQKTRIHGFIMIHSLGWRESMLLKSMHIEGVCWNWNYDKDKTIWVIIQSWRSSQGTKCDYLQKCVVDIQRMKFLQMMVRPCKKPMRFQSQWLLCDFQNVLTPR